MRRPAPGRSSSLSMLLASMATSPKPEGFAAGSTVSWLSKGRAVTQPWPGCVQRGLIVLDAEASLVRQGWVRQQRSFPAWGEATRSRCAARCSRPCSPAMSAARCRPPGGASVFGLPSSSPSHTGQSVGFEYDRHAVVDRRHGAVRIRGDDGEASGDVATRRVGPTLPDAAQGKQRPVSTGEGKGLLQLAVPSSTRRRRRLARCNGGPQRRRGSSAAWRRSRPGRC